VDAVEEEISHEKLQEILTMGQNAAMCAAPQKVGMFERSKALSSSVTPAGAQKIKSVRDGDVKAPTAALRSGRFPRSVARGKRGNNLVRVLRNKGRDLKGGLQKAHARQWPRGQVC
jgi:hypothetical protein